MGLFKGGLAVLLPPAQGDRHRNRARPKRKQRPMFTQPADRRIHCSNRNQKPGNGFLSIERSQKP